MDFFTGGATCAAPPYLYAVSAAAGTTERQGSYSCWLEIGHGGGWETSYYHLQNLAPPASVERNAPLGTIACEICAGGFATGPHVHFSLKYNGAYTSLEGVELTGWTIHVGPEAYNTGSIERDGVSLNPWSSVRNDYHTYFGSGVDTSLRFLPGGSGGQVQFPVDDPTNALAGPPIDVGGGDDFGIDLWVRALPGENAAAAITCGANDNWKLGNILIDRRRTGGAGYGVSIAGGRIAFGVTGPGTGSLTLCGTTDVTDGQWHLIGVAGRRHVAVRRRSAPGAGSRRPWGRPELPRQRLADVAGRSLPGARRRQIRRRVARLRRLDRRTALLEHHSHQGIVHAPDGALRGGRQHPGPVPFQRGLGRRDLRHVRIHRSDSSAGASGRPEWRAASRRRLARQSRMVDRVSVRHRPHAHSYGHRSDADRQ
jgi:hypothetical protein